MNLKRVGDVSQDIVIAKREVQNGEITRGPIDWYGGAR